jgi:CheY-like chemotaxis protein
VSRPAHIRATKKTASTAAKGYEVAKALRADATLSRVRLVALSGYAQPEDLQRSLAAGFDAHLAKPVSAEAIESVVATPQPGTHENG